MSGIEYTQQEFLEAVQANNSEITFDKFVQFQQYLINSTRNINAVWNILRAFGFNSALMVEDRASMYVQHANVYLYTYIYDLITYSYNVMNDVRIYGCTNTTFIIYASSVCLTYIVRRVYLAVQHKI